MFRSSKLFQGFPCTHRQWRAQSHCRFVHGYDRSFYFEFAARELTAEQWVMDFGGLKEVRQWLEHWFDHTFLVAQDDPQLEAFRALDRAGVLQLRVLPNAGMEGSAEFVYREMNPLVQKITEKRVWITRVEVRENEKNAACFIAE